MRTSLSHLDGRRLWFVTLVAIVAIVAVAYIVSGPTHTGSPIAVRLAAAAIVTAFVAVAKLVAGPRAAAVTGVVGVLIAAGLLSRLGIAPTLLRSLAMGAGVPSR
jgi:hypothetical protein